MIRSLRESARVAALLAAAPFVLGLGAGAAHSAPYYEVTTSIDVSPGGPYEIAVDSTAHKAYVPQPNAGRVEVIDTTTKSVLSSITVQGASSAAVDPVRQRAYVSTSGGTVAAIDTTSDTIVDQYGTPGASYDLAVDPATHKVYVSNSGGTVTVIDPDATADPTRTISGFGNTFLVGIAVDSAVGRAYVARAFASDVAVIDTATNSIIGTVPSAGLPYKLALDESTHRLYVANNTSDSVSVINTATNGVVTTVPGIPAPVAVAVDPTRGVAYVTNNKNGNLKVTVLDTGSNSVRATVPAAAAAYGVDVDTSSHEAFVPQEDAKNVAVLTTGETQAQAITFSAGVTNGTVGQTRDIAATGGGSGNPVTFSTSSRACTVDDNGDSTATVSYVHVGSCVVDADQAGSLKFDAASQQTSATVAKGTQSVVFTSSPPSRPKVGDTYEAAASGSATGQTVYVNVGTPRVCTLDTVSPPAPGLPSPVTVRFVAVGKCIVTAQQRGGPDYVQSAKAKQTIKVTG